MGGVPALFPAFLLALFLAGCGSKNVYTPKDGELTGDADPSARIDSPLVRTSATGGQLENGTVLLEGQTLPSVLEEGYAYLSFSGGKLLSGDGLGHLLLTDPDGKNPARFTLPAKAASAAYGSGMVAAVTAENVLMLLDVRTGDVLYQNKEKAAFSADRRIAPPVFSGESVLFPTLGGKLVAVNLEHKQAISEQVVGGEKHFNNFLFVQADEERIVAATPHRLMVFGKRQTMRHTGEIRNLVLSKGIIYLFTNDGKVQALDDKLAVIATAKFPFARFVGAGKSADGVYAVEKEGYLFVLDGKLENPKVYELPEAVEAPLFAEDGRFYYKDTLFLVP